MRHCFNAADIESKPAAPWPDGVHAIDQKFEAFEARLLDRLERQLGSIAQHNPPSVEEQQRYTEITWRLEDVSRRLDDIESNPVAGGGVRAIEDPKLTGQPKAPQPKPHGGESPPLTTGRVSRPQRPRPGMSLAASVLAEVELPLYEEFIIHHRS